MKTYQEHRFVDGKPEGLHVTVEHLPYLGTQDGKPSYGLTELEKWKSAAVTTWVGIAVVIGYFLIHHQH